MVENNKKIRLKIILIGFVLTCVMIVATTPLHEAAHWIMSEIDPYSEPVELHLFDLSSQNDDNILSSSLGSVVIKETYPGSFKERPSWVDPIQEFICILLQIILTCFIVTKILRYLIVKNLFFKKHKI